ncbi:hypothetical protein EK21DRAFT_115009 [Setomelanomma holmii]|uniref:Uncharacterized protein n=1 Tax=Setomelanomma holmii TaxID=210430 RepID=A0A9P4LHU8_9PLEO|nr:hypothetical protein EK21DRAFT_115009 [Setomelanomma holmii]
MHLQALSVASSVLAYATCTIASVPNFSLYAYGKDLQSGLKLYYGDGLAYVGLQAPSFVTEAVNITLSLTDDEKFVAMPGGTVEWSSQPTMYIGANSGDLKVVGFTVGNETASTNSTVDGFGLFGGWAFNNMDAGEIEMKFVASPTNETNVYQVKWNAASTKVSGSDVPISLRTAAPAVPRD